MGGFGGFGEQFGFGGSRGKAMLAIGLDFERGYFQTPLSALADPTGLAGAANVQSGACLELGPSGSLHAFAANAWRRVPGLGLWCRKAFTNLAPNARTTSQWGVGNGIVKTSGQAGPAGGSDAASMAGTGGTGGHNDLPTAAAVTSGSVYTFSRLVKPVTNITWLQLTSSAGANVTAYANFAFSGSGSVAGSGGTGYVSSGIAPAGNGWFLIWLTLTSAATASAYPLCAIAPAADSGHLPVSTANGTFLTTASQVVAGRQPGPLIDTAATSAGNGAATPEIAFAQSDEDFTLIAAIDMRTGSTAAGRTIATLLGATSADRIALTLSAGNAIGLDAQASSVAQAAGAFASGGVTSGRAIAALRYRAGKFTLAEKVGAGAVNIGTEGSAIVLPGGLAKLQPGHLAGAAQLDGVVRAIEVHRQALPDGQWETEIERLAA